MKRILFCTFVLLFWLGACGNPTPTMFNQYASQFITRTTYPGLANCSPMSIAGVLQGEVEHPSNADQSDLQVLIQSLPPNFYSNPSNSIQFYRESFSVGGNGGAQSYQDPNPILINGSSTTMTAGILQATGVVPPFQLQVSGVAMPWVVLVVQVNVSGQVNSGQLLIPSFDADPELYEEDHPQYQQLLQLHPFYGQISVDEDFVSLAQQFCF